MKNPPKGSKRHDTTLPPYDNTLADVVHRNADDGASFSYNQCPVGCPLRGYPHRHTPRRKE